MSAESILDRFRGDQFYLSSEELKHNLENHYAHQEILTYLEEANAPTEILFHWPERRQGILTDVGILRHLIAGNIEIYPFDHRLLQSNGYDVRLGDNFFFHKDPELSQAVEDGYEFAYYTRNVPYYNPLDQVNVKASWFKSVPSPAGAIIEHMGGSIEVDENKKIRFFNEIDREDLIIVVPPVDTALGHSMEFIGGLNVITTRISGKSTVGRNLIEVCSDANLGDVGFRSRWTLEITNKSHISAVVLLIEEPIATIQFEEIEPPIKQYDGRYQQGLSLEKIIEDWEPEMMLPKQERLGK